MNTTQPLNKILFLLDEISTCKQRLSIATEFTRDIEIAVLQSKAVELYAEIQQYNRLALHPASTQVQVNHHQNPQLKDSTRSSEKNSISQKEPWPFDTPVIKQQSENVVLSNEVQQKADTGGGDQEVVEKAKITEKQPKPIHPQPAQPVNEKTAGNEENAQLRTTRKNVTDFEKKREKLLHEKDETNTVHTVENVQPAAIPIQETKTPEPEQQLPAESKKETIDQVAPQQEAKHEPAQQQQTPEVKQTQNASPSYTQPQEKPVAQSAEKSLNERLASQQKQTSLNDKFQTNVKKNLADKLKLSPISDLRTAININQRVAFINQLFKGDDKEFKNVVTTVNGFKNFSEAKFFLQSEIATRYSWNEEEPAVQEFMELVYRKFL